jgi:hypothetical protein
MTSNLQDLPSPLAGLRNVKYHYWTDRRLLSTPIRCDKGDDMGGVVEDVVSGVGDLGQGIISGVDEGLTSLDDEVINTDLGKAALLAAGAYYAAPYVMGTGAATGTGALTATDLAIGGGSLSGIAPTATGLGATALTATDLAMGGGSLAGTPPAAGTSLLGSVGSALGNLSTAQQIGLGAAALGATGALGGSTPSSSTATTSIDPDVKAAYLRNLEEARTVGAGLGARQFAEFPEYNLGMVQNYMNPYENIVVQNTLADIERARQGQISAEGARATAAGAFGGTRQAVTRSLVDEAALRNAGNLAAQLRQGGFTQAQNLGLSQEALRQQYEQSKLDAARGLPLERLNIAQGALSLQPARIGESTTSPIYRNQAASGLGGALGGASLGKMIGGTANPEYAGYGAAAGGLLGFLG